MRRFEYFEPKTVEEAIKILAQYGDNTKILAGGTILVPELKSGNLKPDCVINIKAIERLCEVGEDHEGIHIGALVPLAELAMVEITRRRIVPPSLVERIPIFLRKMISLMGNPQVRNIATIVGNLAWGSPAADSAPPLLALDAQLKLHGSRTSRVVALDEFFLAPGKTALKQDEVITEILIPATSLNKVGMSHKFMKRKANTLSVCSASVSFNNDEGKSVKNIRIAVGAVAPVPMRIKKAESLLEGQSINDELLKKMRETISKEISPITDQRSTTWFRKEVTPILVERCIREAFV